MLRSDVSEQLVDQVM